MIQQLSEIISRTKSKKKYVDINSGDQSLATLIVICAVQYYAFSIVAIFKIKFTLIY